MKFTNRITCLLLACLMTLLAIPVFALGTVAASADPLAEKVQKVTISFRMADARGDGASIGTLVAERKADPGFISYAIPTADECLMRGVDPAQILGWYHIDANGVFYDAEAYSGSYITEDMTFYPYLKSSEFNFAKGTNFPRYKTLDGIFHFLGMRGGWSVGHYNAAAGYVAFTEIPGSSLAQAPGKGAWDHGACYLSGNSGGGGALVLPKTNTGAATAIAWTALVDGTVTLDFNSFSAKTGGSVPTGALAYLAVAHNGVIIWPEAAKGKAVDTAGCQFADKGWYAAAFNNTSALTSATTLDIPSAIIEGLEVEAGDTVHFLIGRGNFATAELNPKVSYTALTENYWDAVVTEVPAYDPGKPFDSGNAPIAAPSSDTAPEISYPGKWELITYPTWASIASAKADTVSYYTNSGSNRTYFLSSIKDYGQDSAAPILFGYNSVTHGSWGERWDIILTNSGDSVGTGGYRYTAEFSGYINASFEAFKRSNFAFNCNYSTVRAAIFVDGVMVWPTAGGDATDMTKWAKPFENVSEKDVDVSAALNETIPEMIYVRKGQKVDFLLTAAETVNVWNGAGNYVRPTVTYNTAFATDFEAYAALGETLTMTFAATSEGGSFAISDDRAYILDGSLAINLQCEGEGSVVGNPVNANGKLSVSVGNIVARRMGDKIDYTLTADIKMPDGTTQEDVVLESGSTSPAEYMKQLVATRSDNAVRDLALATLFYGAEAQRYFKYNTNALIDADLDAELSFTLANPTDVFKVEGTGDYTFTGASLILGDAIKIKLYVDATAAPRADYEELYIKLGDSNKTYPLVSRAGDKDGSFLKAFVTLPYSEFSKTHTFRVCRADGTAVSSVLTYNIDSYAVRTVGASAQANVVAALRAVGQAAANYANISAPTPEGNVVTRVAFLSDLHVGRAISYANEKLTNALKQIDSYYDGKTDLVLFPGDLTHDGLETEYEALVSIVSDPENISQDTRFGFVTGNHEFYRPSTSQPGKKGVQAEVFDAFNRNLGGFHDEEGVNHTFVVNGVFFIGLSLYGEGEGLNEKSEQYLCEKVAEAVEFYPNSPIVIYSHYGCGALWGTGGDKLSAETMQFLQQYPQIVWFSGHTHEVAQDSRIIGQEYYTSVQLPTAGGQLADATWDGPAEYNRDSSQGMFMTISDTNVIKLYRYDFRTGEQIGEPWTLDIPAFQRSTSNFTYKLADRQEVAAAPEFADDAKVTVKQLGKTNINVEIPLAHIDDEVSEDVVIYYHVFVMDKDNKIIASKRVLSEYYRGSRAANYISFATTALTANTDYVLRVVAESVFEKYSDPLVYEFKTKA